MPQMNASWHGQHRMPPRPSMDERIRWHQAHARACGCRPIPARVQAAIDAARVAPVASATAVVGGAGAFPVATYGLTHVALAVRDVGRSARFYEALLGAQLVYGSEAFAQLQTPGTRDVIVLELAPDRAGRAGGVAHFGFRLTRAADIGAAVAAVTAAGGRVVESGEFVPGEPYLYAEDPDGYIIELWYELPTPVDASVEHEPA